MGLGGSIVSSRGEEDSGSEDGRDVVRPSMQNFPVINILKEGDNQNGKRMSFLKTSSMIKSITELKQTSTPKKITFSTFTTKTK